MSSEQERFLVTILLALTAVTGLVDVVSVLGLGRVFTANMTGNVVFLGFATAGAPGLSFLRSSVALAAFLAGALIGGRLGLPVRQGSVRGPTVRALGAEAVLLATATVIAAGYGADLALAPRQLYAVIVATGLAMGIRNAVVRKLGVADLTTTVLTLTLTGLAADSSLAGGAGPRVGRRVGSVALMFTGAAAGAWLVGHSVAHALGASAAISAACALLVHRRLRPLGGPKGGQA